MENILYRIWLSEICSPGSEVGDRLLAAFGNDLDAIYSGKRADYENIGKLRPETVDELCSKDLTDAKDILDYCLSNGITLLAYDDPLYPERLRRIPKAPILLYVRGNMPQLDDTVSIATVGTRRMTEYGRREAYRISYDLAKAGIVTVSGMARGIDTACHRGALDAGGHTIAVLGCGINVVYPPENVQLMEEIARYGTLISEYAPDTPPVGSNFPIRNRIISGLCQGTLVVEADQRSGALITARCALAQGRDLFALPGKVGELNSIGTNELIRGGARMIVSALDIVDEYAFLYPHRVSNQSFIKESQKLKFAVRAPKTDGSEENTSLESLPKFGKERRKKAAKTEKAAKPVKSAGVFESVPEKAPDTQARDPLTDSEKEVLALFEENIPATVDDLTRKGCDVGTVLVSLTFLESKGYISALPGGKYLKN